MLSDFLEGRRSACVCGEVFRLRTPTVETVEVAFSLIGFHISALVAAIRKSGGDERLVEVLSADLARTNRPELVRILETVVEGPGDPLSWPAKELVVEVLRGFDFSRFADHFFPLTSGIGAEERDDAEVDACFVSTARFFSISPIELLRWPVFAFLSGQEAARRVLSRGEPKAVEETPALLAALARTE